ncbi:MAG: hypothetical protein IJZ61_07855 [Oscillospiraceae bacterium]|nr:hypothetical protein [Oscillospiraceae bacterium]
MSEMLRVTTPVAPKDYNLNQNVKPQTPEQVFDLGNVDYVNKTNVRDEQLGEQNLKDGSGAGLPKLQTAISKDPALSAALLKGIVSGGAMSIIGASGDAELLNKVTEFANEVLLSPEKLMDDIIRQQDEATMFSGKLWGALKDMIAGLSGSSVSEEVSSAVLDFLKAAAAANSRDDILTSISASLRFLASETAQSRQIADLLLQTADKLNAENFGTVKNDIQALVNYLEKSLLLNDKTQNLLSLITYNLSRFNGDASALGESFNSLLNMAPDAETAEKLNTFFAQFVEESNLPADIKLAALRDNPSAAAQRSMTMLTERLADAINKALDVISPEKLSQMLSEKLPEKLLAEGGKIGTSTLRDILAPLLPDNMKGGLNTLLRSFEHTKDLNTLIDRLSIIVNRVDNMDNKVTLAQSINLVLTEMAQAAGVDYRPPTTMENMLDFLIKNINDPSLKSLSAMGRPEMLQGLLSAPGVFTPLLHFLVPINMDDTKAFGELWADPDAGTDPETGESDRHLFLCFEIEEAGYFELEIYARGKSVNVALMCPEGTQRSYLPLKETIPTLASACGYNAEKMIIEPLKRRRDLTNVFPKLNERRSGLNVSV